MVELKALGVDSRVFFLPSGLGLIPTQIDRACQAVRQLLEWVLTTRPVGLSAQYHKPPWLNSTFLSLTNAGPADYNLL